MPKDDFSRDDSVRNAIPDRSTSPITYAAILLGVYVAMYLVVGAVVHLLTPPDAAAAPPPPGLSIESSAVASISTRPVEMNTDRKARDAQTE